MLADPIGFRRLGSASMKGLPLIIAHPKLQALHALWGQLRGESMVPARSGFAFDVLKIWLGHVALVEVLREPTQFRVRLFGTRLVEWAGKDCTGRTLDDCVRADQVTDLLDPYHECLARCAPVVRAARYASPGGALFTLEQLLLLCSSDGDVVDVIVAAAYFDKAGSMDAPA
jgi:hypothetical protein